MSCFYINHVFHWRMQTFGSLLHKFQFPATHYCHSPTIPGLTIQLKCQDPASKTKASPSTASVKLASWKHLTESIKQINKKIPHKQTKSRKNPACCSLRKGCSTWKRMPGLTQHTIPLPCTSTTAVSSITKLIYWCLPKEGKSWSNHSHRDKETEK